MSDRLQALADGANAPVRGPTGWFAGRARRREYWLWVVPLLILGTTLAALKVPAATLIMGLPMLFIWIRRLHDLGRTGWVAPLINIGLNVSSFAAIAFMPREIAASLAGLLYISAIIVLGVIPGQKVSNAYGPPPGKREVSEVFS